MQLKMAEVLVAEQKRCLGYGHEHTLHVLRLRGETETHVLYVRSWAHAATFPCRNTCKYSQSCLYGAFRVRRRHAVDTEWLGGEGVILGLGPASTAGVGEPAEKVRFIE
jgi:hypothetical protein